MNWNNNWGNSQTALSDPNVDPRDALSQDDVLMKHDDIKKKLAALKEEEMEWRKYIVKRAFPNAHEGMNTLELGGGYQLKAGVKFNYNLKDNDTVEAGLDRIAAIGNEGQFIAERLVSWTPNFLLTEYRALQEQSEKGSQAAKAILKEVETFLIIDDAAPTLAIKEPKAKK